MTSLNSFSAANTSSIERRRLASDRRQARGVWLQASLISTRHGAG